MDLNRKNTENPIIKVNQGNGKPTGSETSGSEELVSKFVELTSVETMEDDVL